MASSCVIIRRGFMYSRRKQKYRELPYFRYYSDFGVDVGSVRPHVFVF